MEVGEEGGSVVTNMSVLRLRQCRCGNHLVRLCVCVCVCVCVCADMSMGVRQ